MPRPTHYGESQPGMKRTPIRTLTFTDQWRHIFARSVGRTKEKITVPLLSDYEPTSRGRLTRYVR